MTLYATDSPTASPAGALNSDLENLAYQIQAGDSALSAEHRHHLEVKSAIHPEVVAERGVRTITHGRELPNVFSSRQKRRGSGILFIGHRPSGEKSYTFRPDKTDPQNPSHKYEQPPKRCGGPGNVLDVHPSCQHLIDRKDVPVIFVEGIKKGDSVVSAARAEDVEVLVVAVSGVWNWLSDGEPIPDLFDIPVKERNVSVCFDSDMLRNPMVQEAAKRLAGHLISRGAKVFITYLYDKPDDSKMGADDFFATGGSFAKLRLLTRPYDPADVVNVRLSRNEKLRVALKDAVCRFWDFEWKGMGGASARDVHLKLIERARRYGTLVDDGVRVEVSNGTLALEAKVSTRTLWKAIKRLEKWELAYRDNEGRNPDKPGAFVLRANVSHYEGGGGTKEKVSRTYASII